ncbi:MAG: hypothetical protein WD294_11370 [Phycisphaeraceae bacterium]
MKPRLIPIYFEPGRDEAFDQQLTALKQLIGDQVELLAPQPLGSPLVEAEAVVLPQLLGEAYRRLDDFKAIDLPILIVTSEFGTLSMWDWELITYLDREGVKTIAPYNLDQTRKVCAALKVRRDLRNSKFVVYQDNPGQGAQPGIFKRFYWWEDECTQRMFDRFGITIERRSFKALGQRAMDMSDAEAEAAWQESGNGHKTQGIDGKPLNSSMKMYLAVREQLDAEPEIQGVGINCLNESHFSDTTPCLAFSMLYEERQMIWGCEADTVSMLTKYVLNKSLDVPILMTNLYPFLMGQAALKHEGIEAFPEVKGNPADYILVAHCGYMGVIPKSFSTEWTLRKGALKIIDENATAIDARIPEGPITLAKLDPTFTRMTVAEADLTGYAQYPGSDCLNGGVIRVNDGPKLMRSLPSHHALLTTGHNQLDIQLIAPVFDLAVEDI